MWFDLNEIATNRVFVFIYYTTCLFVEYEMKYKLYRSSSALVYASLGTRFGCHILQKLIVVDLVAWNLVLSICFGRVKHAQACQGFLAFHIWLKQGT